MLISALCDYYETLSLQGKVVKDGFSEIGVSYRIALKENGEIDSIENIQDRIEFGKSIKYVPHKVNIIKRIEVSAIRSNFIEHRGLYIFGLNYDKKEKVITPNDDKDSAKKKHEEFVKTNLEFIDGMNSPVVNAFRKFIENWSPVSEIGNPLINSLGKDIDTSNFIFCLSGHPEIQLHEDELVLEKWNKTINENDSTSTENVRQCAILGENLEIARLHSKVKGVRGGQASGTNVICFNNDSENSYGLTQSFNSNVSEVAMKKYTDALNFLLASKYNHQYLDDTTIVFWAQSGEEKADDLMSMLTSLGTTEEIDDEILGSLIDDCSKGALTREKLEKFQEIDMGTDYYFVGIKPNASRLSLKFIYHKKLGDFLINSAQHQSDIKITGLEKIVPLWRLKNELVSPKSKNDMVNPALVARLFDSILNGTPYPEELLQKVVLRIKTDTDLEINPVRAGIIKACINRKNRYNKREEEFRMSLDKENTNQAYLCGRLFAVLEQIQQKSSNYSLNRTIKDSYFASATSRPASIFPKIIKLSGYHLSKLGNPKYFREELEEIYEKIGDEFPTTLSLAEQGKFILGYYHQMSNKNTIKTEEK